MNQTDSITVTKEDMNRALPRIIAVDFDGTLVTDEFPGIGSVIKRTWDMVLEEQAKGSKIVLWTCRDGENLKSAVAFCNTLCLEFDAVNENIPEVQALFGNDTRKVYSDEYWDDKAVAFFCTK